MRLNFFDWIREGVKQSVLLGVSDAATQLAAPEEVEQLNERLISTFQEGNLTTSTRGRGRGGAQKKALGRTLTQCLDTKEKASK